MADTKISEMTAATSLADADLVPVVQGGVNKRGTVDLILDGITAARVNTALGYTAANAASLNSSALTGALPAISGAALTALTSSALSGALPAISGAALTGLTAANLTGTLPDAVFPAVLPAISGANLTNLPGGISGLTTGVVPAAGSGTSLEDSKMTTSGGSKGTWTLYDTGGTGVTQLRLRGGVSNSSTAPQFIIGDPTQSANYGFSIYASPTGNNVSFYSQGGSAANWTNLFLKSVAFRDGTNTRLYLDNDGTNGVLRTNSTGFLGWTNSTTNAFNSTIDIALARSAAGILAVTDGSTGWGSVRAAALGTQTANGAISNVRTISESITLATGGLTTDSSADLLPANSIILSVVARITTTITTTTNWALGDATTAARFAAANATLTAGTTTVGLAHQQGSVATDAAGPVQTAAAKLRITCSGANPGAGTIRVTVTYLELTPPSS